MPTATTLPLLLLLAVLWRATKGNVLAIVMFTSIFDAASAINIGTIGISPWLFALVFCVMIKLLRGHHHIRFTPGTNKLALRLMMLFVVYTIWTAVAHPFMFRGVPVVLMTGPSTLQWSMMNLSQSCYLLADVIIFLLAVTSSRQELETAVRWYVWGCVTAALIGIYQLANAVLHIPYPDTLLYSSPGHVIYRAYTIGGMWRINSTFNEASEMAAYISVGLALLGWTLLTRSLRIGRALCCILMSLSIFLTVSSTGYLCMAIILLTGPTLYIGRVVRQGGLSPAKLVTGMVVILAVATFFASSAEGRETVTKVVRMTLLDKDKSDSYRYRRETQTMALVTMSETYYMGAGWGSIRTSGFFYSLLGTVGVIGLGLFCGFYGSLFLPLFRRRPQYAGSSQYDLYNGALFALTILMCAMAAAGSEPVMPVLWLLFGITTVGRSAGQAHSDHHLSRLSSNRPTTFSHSEILTLEEAVFRAPADIG